MAADDFQRCLPTRHDEDGFLFLLRTIGDFHLIYFLFSCFHILLLYIAFDLFDLFVAVECWAAGYYCGGVLLWSRGCGSARAGRRPSTAVAF